MSVATRTPVDAELIAELREILGDEDRVLVNMTSRINRTRVPAPFPVHRFGDFLPDLAVLPTSAEQVSGVLRLANRRGIPVVPRAGGTGLADGAVPAARRHRRRRQAAQRDQGDRPGRSHRDGRDRHQHAQAQRRAAAPWGLYPDDPASYPCSIVGGRIGTGGWSLLGARYGHSRDLIVSMQVVLPTGEIIEVGDGGGRKLRKSSTGFMLKQLFMGHQGTLGIATEATLELVPRPECEFSAFFAFDAYMNAYRTTGASPGPGWPRWRVLCSSTSGSCATCAATTRPTSNSPPTWSRSLRSPSTGHAPRSSRLAAA